MSVLLVVTPEGPDGDALCAELEGRGFKITRSESGALAVDVARRTRPDAILMDATLSAMDRWHAVKRLNTDSATNAIPVLSVPPEAKEPAGLTQLLVDLERAIGPEQIGTEPGAPTRVWARQPPAAVVVDASTGETTDSKPRKGRKGKSEGLQGRILVVDDNAMNRDMLSRRLKRRGHHVEVAHDGEHALQQIAQAPFDLVLLDWMMPGLSGIDVLRKLRESYSSTELPVIMATAKSEADDVVQALGLDANDYVTKPLNFDVVHARVQTQLRMIQAHKMLRSSERRYRALLENTGDTIIQYRLDGQMTYVSPACRTLLGFDPDALVGSSLYDWIHPIDRKALERQGEQRKALPDAFTYIARFLREDQQYTWVEVSCRLVPGDAAGTTILAACRDVSEHMVRITADAPPLPLGGDIMAHPGWRGEAPGAPASAAPPSAASAKVVLLTLLDDVDARILDAGSPAALQQEVAARLASLLTAART